MIIWLASYPKSGNTWLRFYIISLLMGKQTNLNLNHLRAIMNYPHSTQFEDLVSDLYKINSLELNKTEGGPLFGNGKTTNYQFWLMLFS